MKTSGWAILVACAAFSLSANAQASMLSNGPNGIQASGLALTGAGVNVGMVELGRVGDPDLETDPMLINSTVDPSQVFARTAGGFTATADAVGELTDHAFWVAGGIISTDNMATGTSTGASLASVGILPTGPTLEDVYTQVAVSGQHIITAINGNAQAVTSPAAGQMRAINYSININPGGSPADGTSTISSFLDFSASRFDLLNVTAGFETGGTGILPNDQFNGIAVAASRQESDGVFRRVSTFNTFVAPPAGTPRPIDILAPGEGVLLTQADDSTTAVPAGTSFAAPHVTGTAALLQEHANTQIAASAAGFTENARRHEVMKAVIMNSADKLEDSGDGLRLGQTRDVVQDGGTGTWLDSPAYNPNTTTAFADSQPVDTSLGVGHLNAARALEQFEGGESEGSSTTFGATNPGITVPQVGWDYDNTFVDGFFQEYRFEDMLPQGSFVSITLAWDREVVLNSDGGTTGAYDVGDTFTDNGFADLDLYLLGVGETDIGNSIARSVSRDSNLEHIFFEIPADGNYYFRVDDLNSPAGTDYAVAWWAFNGPPGGNPVAGDFDGSGVVDTSDYIAWRDTFGNTVPAGTGADGNGDGMIDAADYTIWRDNLGAMSGAVVDTAVPEPTALVSVFAGVMAANGRRHRRLLAVR